MLTSLKGKLLNNVSKIGLLTPTNEEKLVIDPSINLNAGAEILTHFQQEWAELHELNEDNAKNAARLADVIESMHRKISKDYDNVTEITRILNTTPTLNKSVENCFAQIKTLQKSFESTEKNLLELEDTIERLELEKKKVEHKYQLALYKEKKLANFERLRTELAEKHAHNIKENEMKQKKISEERQQVFHDAFNSDLETYKSLGTIPKIEPKVQQASALLEEIQLDLDQKDLESFLNTN